MNNHNNPDRQPDKIQLRNFGLIFGAIVAGLFGLLIPLLIRGPQAFIELNLPVWPWYIAIPMFTLALLFPASLIIVYRPWLKFGAVAGFINTRIILFILFYGIITPPALFRRLFVSDPLKKRFDPDCTTYRITNTPEAKEHMENPY